MPASVSSSDRPRHRRAIECRRTVNVGRNPHRDSSNHPSRSRVCRPWWSVWNIRIRRVVTVHNRGAEEVSLVAGVALVYVHSCSDRPGRQAQACTSQTWRLRCPGSLLYRSKDRYHCQLSPVTLVSGSFRVAVIITPTAGWVVRQRHRAGLSNVRDHDRHVNRVGVEPGLVSGNHHDLVFVVLVGVGRACRSRDRALEGIRSPSVSGQLEQVSVLTGQFGATLSM